MRALTVTSAIAIVAILPHTAIAEDADSHATKLWQAQVQNQPIRQRRSDSDDFGYFGDVTVLLTVTGFAVQLDVAARLKMLSARSVGDLQDSLSKPAPAQAETALRNKVLAKIQCEASGEAELRNTQLGDMLRFEFETHVNRRSPKAMNVVVISGRGLAVFKPHGKQ
jgi:hypothetical protein